MISRRFYVLLMLVGLVLSITPKLAFSPGTVYVTVDTNKTSFILREVVEISGDVTDDGEPVNRGLVGITVEDPLLQPIIARTIPSGTGNPGNWAVEVLSFFPCDSTGYLKTNFERGNNLSPLYFKVTIRNLLPVEQDVLIAVTAYDSSFTPLGTRATFIPDVQPGGTAGLLNSVLIPTWASIGNAPMFASIYSNWPKYGGYPLCPEQPSNFSIIESQFHEPPTNTIPEQTVQNGSYSTEFSLSPEPRPGNYTVNVCAWKDGETDTAFTEFQVQDVTAPPRAAITAIPPIAGANQTISFNGRFSSPEGYNDTITSYAWDFDDGSPPSSGAIVQHQFAQLRNYTVTLNVTDSEGFWNSTSINMQITEIHDVAVMSIDFIHMIYDDWGRNVTASLVIKNKGTMQETVNVTAYYNTSIMDTRLIDLDQNEESPVLLKWFIPQQTPEFNATYIVWAEAQITAFDIHVEDNNATYGSTFVTHMGDLDGDLDVDIYDIVMLAGCYGATPGNPRWNILADLQANYGTIDIYDVVYAAGLYGTEF